MTQFIGEILKKIDLTKAQLERARRLDARMRRIDEEIDQLINDPVVKAHQVLSAEEIDALLEALPRGFHRTELRAWRYKKTWPGRPVTYFGATAAIVVLGKLAHLDPALLERDLMLGEFEGELSIEDSWPPELESLPIDLGELASTRQVGDEWLAGKSSCLLRVPSIILPEERNVVFNPVHADAGKLSLIRERPFAFDGRLI